MPALAPTALITVLAGRQEPHVITQTVAQEFTTYTTIVTLGLIPTDDAGGNARPVDPAPPSGGGGGISSAQLGAILGGVVAFVVILLVACFCCGGRRRQVRSYSRGSSEASYPNVEPPQPRVRRPPPVVERVPGGPKFPTYRAIPIPNPRNPRVRHYQ
ncbi:hypothetical protein HJFPF1_02566 [Paramyrothecium foliicola]|nr:hypothetical protein HJFPF1_02566 [Paramyrothecium foliicola]